ncbi:YajG family lipoprotein [Alkalimonas sp. NCh-2]|uniref:YajG family lipoprotein n=1 Tax=Alkalimonas sp. NCh-2 TaxID=3144846 RepID=UPI0031F652B6
MKLPLIVLLGLVLSGCASPLRPLFVSPGIETTPQLHLNATSFHWQLQDKRTKPAMLSIQKAEQTVSLQNKPDWRNTLQQHLRQHFIAAGARLDPAAQTTLQFNVLTLEAKAKQHPLDHEVHSEVVIEVAISSKAGHYRKRFHGNSSYTAPFKVDPASVERELSQLTERVLQDILSDIHWQQYLRRHA